jgi:5-methyltetrahydrofolate--homocysteine methyltransferase
LIVLFRPIIKTLRGAGFKGPIIIGGAPITQGYANDIGADFYASDAVDGARKLKQAIARQ